MTTQEADKLVKGDAVYYARYYQGTPTSIELGHYTGDDPFIKGKEPRRVFLLQHGSVRVDRIHRSEEDARQCLVGILESRIAKLQAELARWKDAK